MSWDFITEILTSLFTDISMEEGSYRVILVEPQPNNRHALRKRIISKTVGQLLWQRDKGEKWRNHHKLFKALLQLPAAKGLCGEIFEPAFHGMCVQGATLTIYPMTRRLATIDFIFKNDWKDQPSASGPKSETLILNEQTQIHFDDKMNEISSLRADHYYQPKAGNFPSYDSFVYDEESRQISAFQIMVAKSHDLNPKGVTVLYELMQRLGITDFKIRIIVAIFGDPEVTLTVHKDLIQSVCGVYILQLTEKQLYPMLF